MARDSYFAALPLYSEKFSREIMGKVDRHYARLPQSRQYQRGKRNYQLYYGLPSDASPFDVGEVGSAGEQGELSQVHVNHFHHLGQRVLTLTVQDEFGWQPEAANGDHQSQADAIIASSVLEYEKRDKRLDRVLHRQAETSLVYTEAYVLPEWDVRAGKKYDVDPTTGAAVYEGRLRVVNFTPMRVAYDVTRHDADHPWVIVTEFVNKWDLAARYPGMAEQILKLARDHRELLDWRASSGRYDEDTDEVPVYRFFHKPSDACPEGREAIIISANAQPLFDGPTTHGAELPVLRMAPGDMIDTPFGASPLTDISGLQQVYNMLLSTAVTNAANGGLNHIAVSRESNLSPTQLEGGWNLMEYDGATAPQALDFAHTAPEVFQLAEVVKQTMQQLVGMSDTTMGQADPKLSGAAMALLDSKAMQFATLFIASYRKAVQDLGTAIIRLYKRHAKAPRSLEVIVGKGRKRLLNDFTGAQLGDVDRVVVEAKNPLTDTVSGRLDLAEKFIAMGAIQGPQGAKDVIQVYRTGTLDPVLKGPESQALRVQQENERLAEGVNPPVALWDNHPFDLAHHQEVADSQEARENPAIMQAVTAHIQQHVDLWTSAPPAYLMACGIPPPPLPPMPVGPDGAPLPPPGPPGLPPPEGGPVAPLLDTTPPVQGDLPNMPSMPNMPNMPGPGGQQYDPSAGAQQ